jgi:hypothetical protein
MPNRFRSIALVLLVAAGGVIAAPPPRINVDGIAGTIEQHYFDAKRGAEIASDLRASAERGEFDALTDERDLASTLTERLRPVDHHFSVSWSAAQDHDAQRTEPPRVRGPQRRSSSGVRRVEVQPGNIGYVDLREFADFEFGKPNQPARQAIEAALQLVSGTDALIIDLRDNGGGSPAMVGYLSSAFTAKRANIYNTFHYRKGTASEAPHDWYPHPRLQTPLYVLISARTGSAAEAFAYTMKNAKRAIIVGEASAGAANPGGEFDAGNGFSIFVSTGSPVSPITGTNWEGTGVAPDVSVASVDALASARVLALEGLLAKGLNGTGAVEARWALEAQRAESAPAKAIDSTGFIGTYGPLEVGADKGSLFVQRGHRPRTQLLFLGADVFSVVGEPSRRFVFQRDTKGVAVAIEAVSPEGTSMRFRRGG